MWCHPLPAPTQKLAWILAWAPNEKKLGLKLVPTLALDHDANPRRWSFLCRGDPAVASSIPCQDGSPAIINVQSLGDRLSAVGFCYLLLRVDIAHGSTGDIGDEGGTLLETHRNETNSAL